MSGRDALAQTGSSRPIRFDSSGWRAYRKLAPGVRARVDRALRNLVASPIAGRPLAGNLAGRRSKRCGSHRVIYRVCNETVLVVAIGPRRSVYRAPR